MNNLQISLTDVVIFVATAGLSWWILNLYGIIGGNKAAKKAASDKKQMDAMLRKRKRATWLLGQFEHFATKVGGGISLGTKKKYDFYIIRRDMQIKVLSRLWKPIELVGLFRMIGFMGVLLCALGLSQMQFNILWLCFGFVFIPKIWEASQEHKLIEEDAELEQDFPDLYLLLNPKLQMGANARIANTLQDYLVSLDITYAKTEHIAIKKFVRLLRNNIELLGDEVLALTKVRELYKSAIVINFCNIAIQALNGVDNREKLVAFEQELTRRKMDEMRVRAQKLVAKGEKAIYAVWLILAEFVLLSLWSRIGGSIDGLFNLM